ncbi:EF hand domain containing protein [Acanthamoeba castellanii str. Neff]|uniref:EF hand domain containing protein n=1 Tax=Acanthamoeba castellanii (strain ATCC 30010 / Neff) TaxID=1257118 RepID=L8GYH0_ACACF|nr:EF hand domain containing protein [Acanthamoeba castellanii str. Neff]ELR18329.1 EF hand domain containing protein [Acanthamoeba castellanii str. Neff]
MEKFIDSETLSEMKEAFGVFDQNGDGRISDSELNTVLTTMNNGTPPDPSLLQQMIAELDIDGNGTVELEEFLQWSIRNKEANGAEQQLRSVFDVFDKNKDGFIDTSELTQVMAEMGERLSAGEIAEMMLTHDLDSDGLISFEEFMIMMTGKGKKDFINKMNQAILEKEEEERKQRKEEKKERKERRKKEREERHLRRCARAERKERERQQQQQEEEENHD